MNKEYFSQSESSTFQVKPSKPGKQTNHLYPSRKNPFALIVRHYMCTAIVLVRFRLKINLTPMLLEFMKVTKRKSTFHGINTISFQSIHGSSNEEICSANIKRKNPLMAKKNTIFKLSFPKLAGSIPWDGNVHICCERKCQTKKTPVLQKKKKNQFYWN